MYAVVETGGRQYKVTKGQVIEVEKIAAEPGETVTLGRVLMVENDGKYVVGQPVVPKAKVTAKVLGEKKGEKLIVFKYKPKARYRRKTGHRQTYTQLEIADIVSGGK